MKNSKLFTGALAVAALVFALAMPATAANPICGLNNGKPATGAPIPIGAVVSRTGPADFGGTTLAVDAYFKCVNANGGIHGRPITYTVMDDAWNPETAAEAAAKLVRDLKVVALVGNGSQVDCGANEALYEAQNVLVIASVGIPRECFHSKNIAPTNGGPRMSGTIVAQYMHKTFGDKRFVCVSSNVPSAGKWMCDGAADWGKSKGIEVKEMLLDPSSLDATSNLLQAMSFHPDDILNCWPKEPAVPFYAVAEQQALGAKVHWSELAGVYDVAFPKAIGPYWDNKIYIGLEFVPLDTKSPDMDNMRAIMDKYGDPKARRDTFTQSGYLAAKITTEALLKLDPTKIDRAAVTKALRDVKGFRSDMLCSPWYFGPGNEHNANHAGRVVVTTKNGFTLKSGCVEDEDPDLAGIRKMEQELHLTK